MHLNSSIGSASFTDFAVDCNNRLNFHVGDTRQCQNVTLHNDDICEWNGGLNEGFRAQLMYISGSNIGLGDANAFVQIEDTNELECSKSILLLYVDQGLQ